MEKLLGQIRDNLRLTHWATFPGNALRYAYNVEGKLEYTHYIRDNKIQFSIEYAYDEWGNMIEQRNKRYDDNGTHNV